MSAPAVYGPNMAALATYLLVHQHAPVARAAELIGQVGSLGISTGWVRRALWIIAEELAEVE